RGRRHAPRVALVRADADRLRELHGARARGGQARIASALRVVDDAVGIVVAVVARDVEVRGVRIARGRAVGRARVNAAERTRVARATAVVDAAVTIAAVEVELR